MRVALCFVFYLVLNNVIALSSNLNPTPSDYVPRFDCDELTSQVQALKGSSKTKKEKFSCILNLLKSVLTEELENARCERVEENKDNKKVFEDNINKNQMNHSFEIEIKSIADVRRPLLDTLETKMPQIKMKESTNDTDNLEIPTMIPIFKPRPVRNELNQKFADNSNPSTHIPKPTPAPKTVQRNLSSVNSVPKFTIPCQRAADILDMSTAPRQISDHKRLQPIMKPMQRAPSHKISNQPCTISVNCADSEDTVAMLFKPKAISLMQMYGNLLKKITITVLVPYHMSKLGTQPTTN